MKVPFGAAKSPLEVLALGDVEGEAVRKIQPVRPAEEMLPMTSSVRTIRNCRLEAAGMEWEAIRVPRSAGLDALAVLGPRSGAVLEDPMNAALYFFIPSKAVPGWDVAGTRILGEEAHLVIPPDRRTQGPGPHWRVCPVDGEWATDAAALRAALEDVQSPAVRTEQSR